MKVKEAPLYERIKESLDGRTQRWLCFNARIAEADLSRKMNGKLAFSQKEIDRINELLNTDFKPEAI